MSEYNEYVSHEEPIVDRVQENAQRDLTSFFEKNADRVFYVGQVEVLFEDKYFHWVTNRALKYIEGLNVINTEVRPLIGGSSMKLLWHHGYRYYKREAKKVLQLVRAYSDSNIGAAIGIHGEAMVLEGFARCQFVMHGKETRRYRGEIWNETEHDLDFVFEKDGVGYGVEVKNKLAYMDKEELDIKMRMCKTLGLKPLFAVRMLPKCWIKEIWEQGGFALILKHQLYPPYLKTLAKRISRELEMPVDTPRALLEGTMKRVLNWHQKFVNMRENSHKKGKKQ